MTVKSEFDSVPKCQQVERTLDFSTNANILQLSTQLMFMKHKIVTVYYAFDCKFLL